MELSELQPDTFVGHRDLGIGRITGLDGSQVIVDFYSSPDQRLTIGPTLRRMNHLPKGGLGASFYLKTCEVLSWVEDKPLRLVGATLTDLGGSGKVSDLKSNLETILLLSDAKWSEWWKVVEPNLKKSRYFQVDGRTYSIADGCQGANIPVEPLSQPVRSSGSLTRKEKALARSIWGAYAKNAPLARTLLEYLPNRMDIQNQEILRREFALVAFPQGKLKQQASRLERILSISHEESRPADEIQRIIWKEVSDGVSVRVGYERIEQLNQELAEEQNLRQSREEQLAREQADKEKLRQSYEKQLARERDKHAADFKQWQREEERLNSKNQSLQSELDSKREVSKLDIRRDVLKAISATIDGLHRQQVSTGVLLRDAESDLKLALQAGDAEFYGVVGEQVEYDPNLHQASERTPRNSLVTIQFSGVRVPGNPASEDLILLKARVHRPEEAI